MELPRGRFHRLIKNTLPGQLLEELSTGRFTGYCTLALGNGSAVLVLEDGRVILAECSGRKGHEVLEALQGDGTMEVSAELHTLTPMQMNLARDFNKSCSLEALERSEKRPSARMQAGKTSPAWGNAIPAHSRSDEIDSLMDRMGEMDMEKMVSSFRGSCRDLLQKIHLDHLIQDSEG